MNLRIHIERWAAFVLRWWMFIPVFILLPFISYAQQCTTIVYVDAQTVKAGELLTITGGEINAQPGKQIVIDKDGRAVFQAAKRIELNSGFKALTGSGLSASIVACDPKGVDPSVVYPNPTEGILNIKAAYKMSALRLSDMSGFTQLMRTDIDDVSASLDLSSLKPGYYILEIIAGKSVVETVRIEKK